jgi:hypothetical protein
MSVEPRKQLSAGALAFFVFVGAAFFAVVTIAGIIGAAIAHGIGLLVGG